MIDRRASRDKELALKHLRARYAAERRFRLYGIVAVSLACLFLSILLSSIFTSGFGAFKRTMVRIPVHLDPAILCPQGECIPNKEKSAENSVSDPAPKLDYTTTLKTSIYALFPGLERDDKRKLMQLFSTSADTVLKKELEKDPSSIGTTRELYLPASSDMDQLHKGAIVQTISEGSRRISDKQLAYYLKLLEEGRISSVFNWGFFTGGDSRSPENAGIAGALLGSLFTLFVCLMLAFPIGVATAVYLEEFAPKNRWTELIEVNINNLAAVPSIIFGLLGLAIILNLFGLPRGTPLVGGVVLALMTLPTMIIACRASIKAVPPSIRQGAMAIGASPVQVVLHHVIPLALPGTLTGAILGLARAIGETAPLLMIGMVAFIVDIPSSPLQPSAALPVQIYLWAESAERGFAEKTSAAIMVILTFLICMNATAVYLRTKFERRW